MRDLPRLLMITGAALLALGALFRWTSVARLPGSIVVRRGNFTFYFPVLASIILSIALTLLMWLLSRR